MAPTDALRAWLLLFVDAIAAKQLIAPALNTLLGDPKKVFEASYAKMHQAIRALVKRGVESGEIRSDLEPMDLLRALIGVSNVASAPDWQAERQKISGYPHRRLASRQIVRGSDLRNVRYSELMSQRIVAAYRRSVPSELNVGVHRQTIRPGRIYGYAGSVTSLRQVYLPTATIGMYSANCRLISRSTRRST